jgi:hypothetical protein
MQTMAVELPRRVSPRDAATCAKSLYFSLLDERDARHADARGEAADLLRRELARVDGANDDLPATIEQLPAWAAAQAQVVGARYAAYRAARTRGGARRCFASRAHALWFLRAVAPTKLVDGSWLYGVLTQWRDDRLRPLVTTYLEELGDGRPEHNHVVIYRRLLAQHGCDDWATQPAPFFRQGLIQLALAWNAREFLPEIIGFNLGYEQLPLHLPVTAFELTELDIDPRYFTLHVTIDNRDSGHARKALQAVALCAPELGDREAFYRRLRRGYQLNDFGLGSESLMAGFDIDAEVVRMLARKSVAGSAMHADRCRLGGRPINDWLRHPEQMGELLDVLQRQGWIKRHQPPQQSRFWHLLQGRGAMFGVFSPWELQLLHDWIAGDLAESLPLPALPGSGGMSSPPQAEDTGGDTSPVLDFNDDLSALQAQMARLPGREAQLDHLLPLLSPARHHTVPGLQATRLFSRLLA